MKKIPSLFPRDFSKDGRYNTAAIRTDVRWVFDGVGVATRKFDGTCCLLREGKLFKRYDAKVGRTPPSSFEPCQEPDAKTGHWPGWVAITTDSPEDKKYFVPQLPTVDGTYELCGSGINGNAENITELQYFKHGSQIFERVPLSLKGIIEFLKSNDIEGLVFHHPDGRMVKVTKNGFGIKR